MNKADDHAGQAKKLRSDARNQHYVPRCLLAPFASPGNGKKLQVRVFDKSDGRAFLTAIENVFAQRDFNTFESEDSVLCLEDGMAAIEDLAAPVLKKLITSRSLMGLTASERANLLVFVALQKVRGVALRAQMAHMVDTIRGRFRSNGDDPEAIPQLRGVGADDVKLSALNFVREGLGQFVESFENKTMLLLEVSASTPFLLGDTPVVWDNRNDTFPYGNLGLEVLGIEIYLPVTPNLALGFWCPSILAQMQKATARFEDAEKKNAAIALLGVGQPAIIAVGLQKRAREGAIRIKRDLHRIASGQPIENSAQNVEYLNSLQVAQAERYIISTDGNFSLPERMVRDNEEYRKGARFQIA